MAADIITCGVFGMSMNSVEMDALRAHINTGLGALEFKKDLPDRLVFNILDGLASIQKTYQEILMQAFHNDYAQLVADTLVAFKEKGYLETYEYHNFLKILKKLIEDMMIAISLAYGHTFGTDSYYQISENYDTLLNLENKIYNASHHHGI